MNGRHKPWCCCEARHGGLAFGTLLLVIGIYFLAQDQGWISSSLSFWPVVIISLGAYFIVRGSEK